MEFRDILRVDPDLEQEPREKPGRYGHWTDLVQEIADGDFDRAARILRWPLRSALLCYRRRMKTLAVADLRHRWLLWAVTAPHFAKGKQPNPPEIPEILRGPRSDGEA